MVSLSLWFGVDVPKIVNHDERRAFLIEQSFDLFAQHGYTALSMRQLAKSMGVTTGVLYHYFPSKEALFEELFQSLREQDIATAIADMQDNMPLEQRIDVFLGFLLARADRMSRAIQIALEYRRVQQGPHARRFLQETIQGYRDALQQHLLITEQLQISSVLSFIFGLLVYRQLDPDNVKLSEQLKLLSMMLRLHNMAQNQSHKG